MKNIDKMKLYRDLQEEAHRNACVHGWHDKEVSFEQMLLLLHSEISEACEEFRSGKPINEIYFRQSGVDADPQKPEGFPVELADVVIRIMDYCGLVEFDMARFILTSTYAGHFIGSNPTFTEIQDAVCNSDGYEKRDVVGTLVMMHRQISGCDHVRDLCRVLLHIMGYCHLHELALYQAMVMKMKYNRTRPHRHGGKTI